MQQHRKMLQVAGPQKVKKEQTQLWERMKEAVRRYRLAEIDSEEMEKAFAAASRIVPDKVGDPDPAPFL